MSMQTHLKRNGDGSISVSIPLATLLALMTIIIAVVPAVMAYGSLNTRVDNIEADYEAAVPKQTKVVEDIETRLDGLEKIAIGTEISLNNIEEDIKEIKQDVKDVKQELRERNGGS